MFMIPEDKLPNCLKDEQRINVLFAPIRSRNVNPKDWDSKISSWKTIIKTYCEQNNVYSFSMSSLRSIFVRNGRPPSCLNEVVNDMIAKGEIQVMDEFLRKNVDTWRGWVADVLIKRPLTWSFDKIKNYVFSVKEDQSFVLIDVIKTKSESLLNMVPDNFRNKLISLKDFLTVIGKYSNLEDIELLLHYLENNKKIAVTNLNQSNSKDELETLLIKFGDGQNIIPITEVDIGVYTLEQNEKIISKHIESLEDEIHQCVKEAKVHLSKNHRHMAKSSLRKKHELEKRVEKKANALHNINILLEQIHDTHSNNHVWDAYKQALAAFDTTFKTTGLSEDAIDDTMIKIGDMLDKHDDIQAALSRPTQDANQSEFEEELAELLEAESEDHPPAGGGTTQKEKVDEIKDQTDLDISSLEIEMGKINLNLPDVPTVSPNVTQELAS